MKKSPQSESEAKGATAKSAALGARFFLPYPRPVCQYRISDGFNQETRVWETILHYVLRHEGHSDVTFAQVAGEIQADGTETGFQNGRIITPLRPMTQADIGAVLHMQKSDVSRNVKKLAKKGLIRQSGKAIHLVGSPKNRPPRIKDLQGKVAWSRNFTSAFLPPPGHPREKSWLDALVEADQQLASNYNTEVRNLKARHKKKAHKAFASIVGSFKSTASDSIDITKAAPVSREKTPSKAKKLTGPRDSKVTGSRNVSPFVRSGPRNSKAPKVARSGHPIREERVRGDLSPTPPGGQAGHSSNTVQRESQPASQPVKLSKQGKQKAEEQQKRELERMFQADQLMHALNRRFTRRFALPATPEQVAEILARLHGADQQQLFDLIKRKPHIRSWAGVGPLADDCAATQDAWRGADQPSTQQAPAPRTKADQRAEDYQRRRHDGKKPTTKSTRGRA